MMRSIFLSSILLGLVVAAAAGCDVPYDQDRAIWYDFRGNCHLMLTVQIRSNPSGAEVYIGDDLKGVTPFSMILKAEPTISGSKCKFFSPVSGKTEHLIRATQFESRTPCTFRAVRKGYEHLSQTIIIEDFFPSETLQHDKKYEKAVTMTFEWE